MLTSHNLFVSSTWHVHIAHSFPDSTSRSQICSVDLIGFEPIHLHALMPFVFAIVRCACLLLLHPYEQLMSTCPRYRLIFPHACKFKLNSTRADLRVQANEREKRIRYN